MSASLFDSLQAGAAWFPNRILMAPLTRCRAEADHVPGPSGCTNHPFLS